MKFCSKCGHQLVDEALICTGCGCMVGPSSLEGASFLPNKAPAKKASSAPAVFAFLFSITTAFYLFFLVCSIVYAPINTTIMYESAKMYSHNHEAYSIFWLSFRWAIWTLIFSFMSFVFAFVGFIVTLVKKSRCPKILSAITRLIIGILLIILSFIMITNSY